MSNEIFKSKVSNMLAIGKDYLSRSDKAFFAIALYGIYKIIENPDLPIIMG